MKTYRISKFQREERGVVVSVAASSSQDAAQQYATTTYGERARILPGAANCFHAFIEREDKTFYEIGNRIWVREVTP